MALKPVAQVQRQTAGTIIDDLGHEHAVTCVLDYGLDDPFAVTLTVTTSRRAVPWTFARELLTESLYAPAGAGDVHLWPTLDADGNAMVAVELTNASVVALILVSSRDVAAFLDASYLAVASGEESLGSDFDLALQNLLAEHS